MYVCVICLSHLLGAKCVEEKSLSHDVHHVSHFCICSINLIRFLHFFLRTIEHKVFIFYLSHKTHACKEWEVCSYEYVLAYKKNLARLFLFLFYFHLASRASFGFIFFVLVRMCVCVCG